ncbi:MAG TPA: YbdK family carboxylate-amine ligase [Solirubrobacterales bacterium]|nr:YbdK family carboxylate-amine ligase [Solirubrobacterales bacterium]
MVRPGSAREEHRFGASAPLSLGVEEELLLVDGSGQLISAAEDVLESVAGTSIGDRVSSEIFTEQIELKTGVCRDAGEVLEQLSELRRDVGSAGFELLACGLHPTAAGGDAVLIAKPRYEVVQKDLGSLLRTPPCGLHVHVGAPDAEAAVKLANAFRLYLPALQALSANSPFQEGRDSGHASARTQVVRSYPRFQVPRGFRDYADFLEVADQLVAAAGVDDYTYIWWDVRPHPRLGTVEVRAVDVATEPRTSAAFAALIQAIAAKELDRPSEPDLHREALEESYFQAASHGLDAEILFESTRPTPAPEAVSRILEQVRPYARELYSADALDEVERILREGNGAEEQRRLESQIGLDGLLARLIERSR